MSCTQVTHHRVINIIIANKSVKYLAAVSYVTSLQLLNTESININKGQRLQIIYYVYNYIQLLIKILSLSEVPFGLSLAPK